MKRALVRFVLRTKEGRKLESKNVVIGLSEVTDPPIRVGESVDFELFDLYTAECEHGNFKVECDGDSTEIDRVTKMVNFRF